MLEKQVVEMRTQSKQAEMAVADLKAELHRKVSDIKCNWHRHQYNAGRTSTLPMQFRIGTLCNQPRCSASHQSRSIGCVNISLDGVWLALMMLEQSQVAALEHQILLLGQDKEEMIADHAHKLQSLESILYERAQSSADTVAVEHELSVLQAKFDSLHCVDS